MDYTTWMPSAIVSEEDLNHLTPATSLYETFQRLPDVRRGQGKRYE